MSENQVSVFDQIKLIIAGANPEDLKKMPVLEQIQAEVIKQEEEKKKQINDLLKILVGKLGMVADQNLTIEDFAKNCLRIRGYKKFSKRAGKNGQGAKQKTPITEEQINDAKKQYNNGRGKDVRKIATELGLNTNSLKKILGIGRLEKLPKPDAEPKNSKRKEKSSASA